MNTPTHFLIALAVLGKPGHTAQNSTILLGAVLPDLSIYMLAIWAKLEGIPQQAVWGNIYWQEPWQTMGAISNSVPLYVALLVLGLWRRNHLLGQLLVIFALTCLLHMVFDFFFHAEDAHQHFWPLTDWRFHSPLSYWNPSHHGRIVGLAEMALSLGLIAMLWQRFRGSAMRITLAILGVIYITVPVLVFFVVRYGSH